MTHQSASIVFRIIGFFFIFALFACSNSTQPSGFREAELIELAREETQKTRSLSFIRPVKTSMITRDQYRKLFSSRSSSQQELIMNAFKQYGFVPDTMSSAGYITNHDENFAGAFYKPKSDSLYIIDATEYNDATLFAIAAHEFTHALQEQHFNSFANQNYPGLVQSSLSSDYYLSQLCIIEGDARLSEVYTLFNYAFPTTAFNSTDSFIKVSNADYFNNIKSADVPSYLNIQGYAPYQIGARYVWDVFAKGKWDAVNRLHHADRPISTRQIITGIAHPIYSFDFSAIMPVLLSNTTKLVFADDDTYGPIMLMALLSNYVDYQHCLEALGWEGDRCAFTLSDNQKWGSFVWALKFNTTQNTQYVYERLDSLYTKRNLGQLATTRIADTSGISYTNANSQLFLRKSGTSIFIMDNVNSKATVLAALDKPSAIAKKQTQTGTLPLMTEIRVKHQIIDMIVGH